MPPPPLLPPQLVPTIATARTAIPSNTMPRRFCPARPSRNIPARTPATSRTKAPFGVHGRLDDLTSTLLAAVVVHDNAAPPLLTGGVALEFSVTMPADPNEQLGGSLKFDGEMPVTVSVTVPENPPDPATVIVPWQAGRARWLS